jgi:hypothetical protein
MPDNDEILYMFYVNKEKLNSCPRVPICTGNQHTPAVIDTGSHISLLAEELYYKLRSEGVEGLELGVQNAVLVSAFGNKTKRIRVQAMMPIRIDDIVVNHIFLISPQLLTPALLGVDFFRMNNIIINFPEQCFTLERYGNVSRHHFAYDNNIRSIGTGDLGPADHSTKTDIESMQIAANSMTNGANADYPRYNLRSEAVREVDVISRSESKDNGKGCPFGKRASGDNDNCMIHDPKHVTLFRLNECCSSQATSDDRESEGRGEEVMSNYDVFATSRLGRFEERNVGDTEPATDTRNVIQMTERSPWIRYVN